MFVVGDLGRGATEGHDRRWDGDASNKCGSNGDRNRTSKYEIAQVFDGEGSAVGKTLIDAIRRYPNLQVIDGDHRVDFEDLQRPCVMGMT